MTHTLTITTEEIEMLYFALNDYAMKYMDQSKTWGRSVEELLASGIGLEDDYCARRAHAINSLQVRVGDILFDNQNQLNNEAILAI